MVQRKKCRSRQELSDEYLLAKVGIDPAENAPPKGSKKAYALNPSGGRSPRQDAALAAWVRPSVLHAPRAAAKDAEDADREQLS